MSEALRARVQDSLDWQGTMRHLDVRLVDVESGQVELALP